MKGSKERDARKRSKTALLRSIHNGIEGAGRRFRRDWAKNGTGVTASGCTRQYRISASSIASINMLDGSVLFSVCGACAHLSPVCT